MKLHITIETDDAEHVEHWEVTDVGPGDPTGDLRRFAVSSPDGTWDTTWRISDGIRNLALIALMTALPAEADEIEAKYGHHRAGAGGSCQRCGAPAAGANTVCAACATAMGLDGI